MQYWTENEALIHRLDYSPRGELTRVTDSKGTELEYSYSANGFMIKAVQKGSKGSRYESSMDWDELRGSKDQRNGHKRKRNVLRVQRFQPPYGRVQPQRQPTGNACGTVYVLHTETKGKKALVYYNGKQSIV